MGMKIDIQQVQWSEVSTGTIASGANLGLDSSGDLVKATVSGGGGGSTAADDVTTGDGAVSISTSSGDVLVDSQAGATTIDGHTGVTVRSTSSGNVTLNSVTGVVDIQDGGSSVLTLTEGNSGDVTVKLVTNGKDLIFTDNGDAEGFRVLDAAAGVKVAGDIYVDKIRRATDSGTTTKILLNDEVIKFYADHSVNNICTIDSTGLKIDNGSLETATIDYTDGDNAMTIADGGKVTFSSGFAVGSDAAGDILYHNGTSYIRLAKGTADQVLTMNDAATAPNWETASGGGSSESTDSYSLVYGTLSGASGNTASILTVPADKTLVMITVDIGDDAGFESSSGAGYGTIAFKIGDVFLIPRGSYSSYGSPTEGTAFIGYDNTHGAVHCRIAVGGSSTDIDLYWANHYSTLIQGAATIKAWYR